MKKTPLPKKAFYQEVNGVLFLKFFLYILSVTSEISGLLNISLFVVLHCDSLQIEVAAIEGGLVISTDYKFLLIALSLFYLARLKSFRPKVCLALYTKKLFSRR